MSEAEKTKLAPILLTIEQVCQVLNLGRNTVLKLTSSGELPTIRFGRTGRAVRVPYSEAEAYVKRRLHSA